MEENKWMVVYLLETLLKYTRFGSDIRSLEYAKSIETNDEYVIVKYNNPGDYREVLITADSGIAIIKDVLKALGA